MSLYQRRADGRMEEPLEAQSRIALRRFFNRVALGAVVAATTAVTVVGARFLPEIKFEPRNSEANQQVSMPRLANGDSGLALSAFIVAGLIGVVGGGVTGVRLLRDSREKSSVDQDVIDGMYREKGKLVYPYHYRPQKDLTKDEVVAGTTTEPTPQ